VGLRLSQRARLRRELQEIQGYLQGRSLLLELVSLRRRLCRIDPLGAENTDHAG